MLLCILLIIFSFINQGYLKTETFMIQETRNRYPEECKEKTDDKSKSE